MEHFLPSFAPLDFVPGPLLSAVGGSEPSMNPKLAICQQGGLLPTHSYVFFVWNEEESPHFVGFLGK